MEGALYYLRYDVNDGASPASGLQIMRNFENATRKAGGTVEGKYPDWCAAYADYDSRLGNTCTYWGISMKFVLSGRSELKPESDAPLREIAALMSRNPSLRLHVVGHTDNVGDQGSNMKLSQARAAAVVAALTGKYSVPADRLGAFGAGPYTPVASNRTEEGRARNRRVELVEQ